MVQLNSIDTSQNSFSFDMTTSSGDHISLSMYDNKEIDYAKSSGQNWKKESLTLRHELGYSFHYDGNGIDKNDQKEIEEAMKLIKPIYQKFLENIKKDDERMSFTHIVTNTAELIKSKLPHFADKNSKTALQDSTLNLFDKIAEDFKRGREIIENSKKLFDKIFKNFDGFEMYV